MEISACGRYCNECETFNNGCHGCYHTRKEKLMTHEENMCPIYRCVMDKYESRICSKCPQLPCENFFRCIDPSFTDTRNIIDIEKRVSILKSLK